MGSGFVSASVHGLGSFVPAAVSDRASFPPPPGTGRLTTYNPAPYASVRSCILPLSIGLHSINHCDYRCSKLGADRFLRFQPGGFPFRGHELVIPDHLRAGRFMRTVSDQFLYAVRSGKRITPNNIQTVGADRCSYCFFAPDFRFL